MIKVIFLGTSAQIPTKERNHTGILLTYKEENILVDCGEGTQRQFRKAELNPCKITKILLTHRHGDHVFGLPGLLSTLNFSEYNKELIIYGPKGIKRFLEEFLGISTMKWNFKIKVEEVTDKKFFETGDFYLEAESMQHGVPTNAYNFVIKDKLRIDKSKLKKYKIKEGPLLKKLKEGKNITYNSKEYKANELTYLEKGKKISFILDTLQNNKIEPFVKDADLLICESSFSEELNEIAKEHLHLTSEQAGKIAKKAKAKKLILTHISQRYENNQKLLLAEAKKNFKETSIVKDFDVLEVK
jgi:ribonuclease Z